MNKKLWFLFVLIALVACAKVSQPQKNVTELPSANLTTAPSGIAFGDLVTINFSLYLENGTLVDTNNADLAVQAHLSNYLKGPYRFILGESGKVKGFDEALRGMNIGDHREVIIPPSEKELVLAVNRTRIIPRVIAVNKQQAFPRKAFEVFFSKPPVINEVVYSPKLAFKYQVVNMTNDTVITKMVLKEGEEYTLPNTEWKSKVAKVAEDDALFYQEPDANMTLKTPFGPATINLTASRIYITFNPQLYAIFNKSVDLGHGISLPEQFQVIKIRDNDFVIKRYGSLADKKLKLVADLLDVTKSVKEVKPEKPLVSAGGTSHY